MTTWINDWANYQAVDEDGDLCEYEYEPVRASDMFVPYKGAQSIVSEGNDATNWQNSLVKRDRDMTNTSSLLRKAEEEIHIFERPSRTTSTEMVSEIKNLIRENEYLRARNAELFAELERVKKVANDLAISSKKTFTQR